MLLHRLRLQNYKQYVELDLEFREGLVGIIGRNGSGKSTLLDAVLYCLYGREETSKSLVRSSFADPQATVVLELEFFIGENLYRARREFRGKTLTPMAELYKNDVLIAKTTSAVNAEVAKVLHMGRDAFKRSVFSGQKELDELTKATREERRKLVRRMLGLERLDEIQVAINADARDVRNRILGQMKMQLSLAEKTQIEADIAVGEERLTQLNKILERERDKFKALNIQHQQVRERFEKAEHLQNRYHELAKSIEQAKERVQQLTHQSTLLAQKITQLQTLRQHLEAQRRTFEAYQAAKKELEALEVEHRKFVNYNVRTQRLADSHEELKHTRQKLALRLAGVEKLPAVAAALEDKRKQLGRIQADIQAALGHHSRLKGELTAVQRRLQERTHQLNQLRALGRGGTCPTCLQPLLDGYERALKQLEDELRQLEGEKLRSLEEKLHRVEAEGKTLRAQEKILKEEEAQLQTEKIQLEEDVRQKEALEKDCKRLEEHIAAEEAILRAVGQFNFDEARYEALKSQVKAGEEDYLEFAKNEAHVQRELPHTMRHQQETQRSLAEAQRQLEKMAAEQQAVGYDPAEYEAARNDLTSFAEQLQEQTERLQQAKQACFEQEVFIQQARERLQRDAALHEQIREQEMEIATLERLSTLIGQFKAEILMRVGPGISREASELFNRITRGRYESIQVNDDFDFSISDGGVYYPIERFSGGEVDLANLCLRIAITKAILDLSGAASQMFGFLAFDEILGSQDEERRLEIMFAFNYLEEQFRQIYIVSHIESLKDFFPNILEVSAGAAGSVVVWR